MTPASWPLADPGAARLLVVDPAGKPTLAQARHLPAWLTAGDLLVVNDAATLPGSLAARTTAGETIEIRLVRPVTEIVWQALIFGTGDWRADTVVGGTAASPRLVTLTFDRTGAAFWQALYRHGRPIQYRHLAGPLPLWHVQTRFASRPWAVEMPSAGFALTWDLLLDLRRHGIQLATLTHAAGLSATGDAGLDAALPWVERYDLPDETIQAIERTKRLGRRVIAAGTSVVRALEGCAATQPGHLADSRGDPGIMPAWPPLPVLAGRI